MTVVDVRLAFQLLVATAIPIGILARSRLVGNVSPVLMLFGATLPEDATPHPILIPLAFAQLVGLATISVVGFALGAILFDALVWSTTLLRQSTIAVFGTVLELFNMVMGPLVRYPVLTLCLCIAVGLTAALAIEPDDGYVDDWERENL